MVKVYAFVYLETHMLLALRATPRHAMKYRHGGMFGGKHIHGMQRAFERARDVRTVARVECGRFMIADDNA